MISLSDPRYLLLLLLLPVLHAISRRSLSDLSPGRARFSLGLRCVIFTLLVFGLAGLQVSRPSKKLGVLFLLDRSDSVPAEQQEAAVRYLNEAARRMGPNDTAGVLVFGGDAYFDYDKSDIRDDARQVLTSDAAKLKQIFADDPSFTVVLEGHCDERGSREYNLVLGEKRAKEVRRYLADRGIKNPVTLNSFGKERPVCTEHEESCYGKNRRAHLAVEGGQ